MQISFAVIAKLISAFVFATCIGQPLYFLYTNIQASNHLVWLYSLICVEDRFSHNEAHLGKSADPPLIQVQGLNCWQFLNGITLCFNLLIDLLSDSNIFSGIRFSGFLWYCIFVILQVIIIHKVQKCHF